MPYKAGFQIPEVLYVKAINYSHRNHTLLVGSYMGSHSCPRVK